MGIFGFVSPDFTTTSLTAVDVPQLSFPVDTNGAIWEFEFVLTIGSSTVDGLKVAITAPAGSGMRPWAMGSGASKNAMIVDLITTPGTLTTAFNTFIGQTNYLSIRGGVQNGSFAGKVQLQIAKVTSGTATVSVGSYFTANQLV